MWSKKKSVKKNFIEFDSFYRTFDLVSFQIIPLFQHGSQELYRDQSMIIFDYVYGIYDKPSEI